jgi:hypothetical protein
MEHQEVNPTTQSTYTIAILFGMWLKQSTQRKRLAKTEIQDLFKEWMELISKQMGEDE